MNITNHAYERYAERILDVKESKQYIIQNKENLTQEINDLFNESIYFYTGKYHDQDTANYYINKDIVLVINKANDAIITLYKVDFGFCNKTNTKIIKDLLSEIETLRKKYGKLQNKQQTKINKTLYEIDSIQLEINSLEKQLEMLKYNQNVFKEQNKLLTNELELITEDINKTAYKICYSINYKLDKKIR